MTTPQVFHAQYEEEVLLDDATPVHLRLVRPDDKQKMLEAWERLSPESRYRRFLSAKTTLTDEELRYLTELDYENHLAIGAEHRKGGSLQAVGVARFVRLPTDPKVAEPAIAVADDFQGRGLGRLLLSRLVSAARERGVEQFRCEVLPGNDVVRGLVHSLAPSSEAVAEGEGETLTVVIPLDEAAGSAPQAVAQRSPLYRAFGLVARRGLVLKRTARGLSASERGE